MKKYHVLVFSLIVMLSLGLSACERSASTPIPDEGVDFPVPGEGNETKSPMEELNDIATMTAMAASGSVVQGDEETPDSSTSGTDPEPAATAEPTAIPPTQVPAGEVKTYSVPSSYTLKSGEFLFCIARRFNIAPNVMMSANNMSDTTLVYAGDVLIIPQNAPVYNLGDRSLRAHPTTYVVQSGDTVNSIACLFGDVDPRNIEAVNNLTGAYTISVGQTIQIP
ncbi:MAG: LysM peptidoglycan-binding domain-containing protein [Anaerolineae bacterium]|nr:LysM peptidoglycan-binding domain-containing protein [Anaerolineae bacterium]